MRAAILILVVTLFGVHDAAAEKVKTNQSTKVYSRPGEQAKVLLKLKSGQNMTMLAKEGRWLKVRVQGRTGYVPRTKVDMPDDDDLVRNTRRRAFVDGRGTKRGFGGETGPDDRVGADATGDGQDDSGDKGDKGDSDDDSDSKPAKASKSKKPSKDDDESDDKPSKASKSKKPAKSDDDEDDDKSAKSSKSKKAKGGDKSDDEDDEDTVVVDDSKTGEPDESDARPTAHVSEKTKILNDPSDDSDESFVAKPDTVLYPAETKGKWTRVENDDGDTGWILSDSLDLEDSGGGGGSSARTMDAHARLGVMVLSQSMKGTGGMAVPANTFNPDNYSVGSTAFTVALGGELLYPWKKKYVVGGEATLDYAKTLLGGIHIPQTTNTTTADTPVSLAIFSLRGMIGYDLKKKNGMMLFGRLGYRYQAFMVDGYDNIKQNPAMLPQETIAAPTLGGAIAIPKLTDKVGLTITLDFILAGSSVSQTAGYQDGTSPSAKAAFLGGVVRYKWKPDMDFQGTYNLDYMSVDFGKPSADPMLNMRGHTATDVSRTDLNHIVTFGIIKGF